MTSMTFARKRMCARRPHRIAVFLDLENLLVPVLGTPAEGAALAELGAVLSRVAERGTIAANVGSCDERLWRRVAFRMASVGVRTFVHAGGEDAADLDLIARARRELPATVDTVVIGSGDHIFTPLVRELRARGRRVELLARFGSIDAGLYRAADACHVLVAGAGAWV